MHTNRNPWVCLANTVRQGVLLAVQLTSPRARARPNDRVFHSQGTELIDDIL